MPEEEAGRGLGRGLRLMPARAGGGVRRGLKDEDEDEDEAMVRRERARFVIRRCWDGAFFD